MVQQGTWAAPSLEEEKIIALETKIQKMQKSHGNKSTNNDQAKGKKGKDKKDSDKTNRRVKPDWMKKAPAQDKMNQSKMVNNKEYWWCKKHKSWTRHKTEECQGKGVNKPDKKTGGNPNTVIADGYKQQLKITNALSAIVESDEE